ncbi:MULTISPECIES: L-threonine 3-dehydrogenase [Psychrobacter]|jgi:threonine 3-dehydrogenase|uniref:L-threonine 3-dehydrogenase n=1 Tax=Psychrobacter TaxID=497 RepID=UPI000C32C9E6|nr:MULTISPECIES: L-threonine 3-dehydrogenase [Psychrobacter]MBA6243735.1 L-threonine 3-dehydrogenase [Psychrobacter sp. Urea-trap-18]MBA6285923.1 L-threonine 3-dehydrogenase [Psychrobacter sp. Urea-trap-16]MBA6319416.1 L-threonine 3-dehydrogenase [Psychrobacter sp. Urea-trap-20]MBA6334213.1 L-threonine 3-dehydrogenase [Psychrobacter sp. Urea-trap-19]PKG60787.1 L-threonine 3-dehydrogenase [Psychrobacter sp. Choline-3u-12]
MKALVKAHAKKGIWMQDMPEPTVGINDVKIKIKKTAICGTDLHIYKWDEWSERTIKTPMIIGHEYVGIISEMGDGVKHFEVGDRVTGEGHIACGHCRNCRRGKLHVCENTIGVGVNRDGAFAEYLVIPADNVIKLDERISDEMAAIMDPFGNATHTALSFPVLGEDVLITGAGLIGSMATAICRFAGARNIVVSDISDYRLELAKKMGATMTINPAKGETIKGAIAELKMHGFDIGLEMSGSPQAFDSMISNMYNGSKIALLGILPNTTTVDWSKIIFKALTLKGIYGREMWETWYQMEQMLISGIDLSPIITHRMHIDDFQEGFDIMESGQCGKVILSWD